MVGLGTAEGHSSAANASPWRSLVTKNGDGTPYSSKSIINIPTVNSINNLLSEIFDP